MLPLSPARIFTWSDNSKSRRTFIEEKYNGVAVKSAVCRRKRTL